MALPRADSERVLLTIVRPATTATTAIRRTKQQPATSPYQTPLVRSMELISRLITGAAVLWRAGQERLPTGRATPLWLPQMERILRISPFTIAPAIR